MSNRIVKDRSQPPFVMIDARLIKALTPLEFITYAQVKHRAWSSDECYESIAHMAKETSMSTGSLKRSLKSLLKQNLIAKEKRFGQTDIYTLTPPDQWKLSRVDHKDLGVDHRDPGGGSQRSTNKIPLKIDPIKKKERDLAEIHTANDRTSEQDRLVSNSSPSLSSGNSQQPTAKQPPTEKEDFEPQKANTTPLLSVDPDPETINCATQQQGSVDRTELTKREEGGGAARKTRELVYRGKGAMGINILVQTGINQGWWGDQLELAAFQRAILSFKEQSGYSEPARAVTAIFTGMERKQAKEIEEIAGYWARYDQATQTIAAKAAEPMPWVENGTVVPGYASWVKSNDRWLDGQLPDGTYKINLILTTTKSNKFARDAWQKYQETLKADEARKRRSEGMATEVYEPELAPLTEEEKARAEAMWLKVAEFRAKKNAAKAS